MISWRDIPTPPAVRPRHSARHCACGPMNDVGCLWAGRPDRRAVIEQTEESTNPRQTADEPVRPVFDRNLVDLPHGQAHESVEPQNLFGRSCYLEKRDTVFVKHIAHLR